MLNIPHNFLDTSNLKHPILCIVIDTEEEFNWNEPFDRQNTSIKNIAQQIKAHKIFEKYNIKPSYIIDYPVANKPEAFKPLKELYDDKLCDIGAHLHPWVTPPFTETVNHYNSFPGNLSYEQEYEKLKILTDKIEENFYFKPNIYKAGRYGVGKNTTEILKKLGYSIDCSVVPNTDFTQSEGPDFSHLCSHQPYWFAENKILEVPLSVDYVGALSAAGNSLYKLIQQERMIKLRVPGILSRLGLFERIRLSPEGHTLDELKRLSLSMLKNKHKIFTLTYHSSTLLAGGSPYTKNNREVDAFLETIDNYLNFFASEINGEFKSLYELHNSLVLSTT